MIVKKMNKKTLPNYAKNQVTQCESEPQEIETTKKLAKLYSKARATTLTGYLFTANFSEKKCIVPKSQMETNIDSIKNLSNTATLKDFYILTPMTVKTNSSDWKKPQTKPQIEN